MLGLTVTPQITPDDRVIMNLEVSNDTVGEVFAGVPSINTQSVTTQVLVDNGETVVLGGVYERASGEQTRRVPFFGSLPGVGWLFRNRLTFDEQSELLVRHPAHPGRIPECAERGAINGPRAGTPI